MAIVLLILSFWMYNRASVSHAGGDSLWSVHTSVSILTDQDLDLSEYSSTIDLYPLQPPPNLMELRGQRLDLFPWGGPLVAAPFVVAVALTTEVTGGDFSAELRSLPLFEIEKQVASLIAATTVALLFLLMYLRLRSLSLATALALAFAFGTGLMSTTSHAMWTQGPAILLATTLLLIAQLLTIRVKAPLRREEYVLAGFAGILIVIAFATRPVLILLTPIVLLVLWQRDSPRLLGTFIGTAFLSGLIVALVNVRTYGELLPPYYRDRLSIGSTFPDALFANLVSPGRGLFVWTPLLLGGISCRAIRWRALPHLERFVIGWFAMHLAAISAFPKWWGGASVGPRLMLEVVPGLFLLLTVPIAATRDAWPRLANKMKIGLLCGCALLTLWAAFVNVRASYRMSVMLWNWPSPRGVSIEVNPDRVWDWADPQFLR